MSPKKRQCTVQKACSVTGTSLHTGTQVTLTLRPAPVDHGLVFRRVDLPDQPFIKAEADKVRMVERATTIAAGSVKVHTVEHVLSALWGMGIDNAVIEMDANEPPIGDGSALPFVECIHSAGIEEQGADRPIHDIRDTIYQEHNKGRSIVTVVPDRRFRISCTQASDDGRFTQFLSLEITPEVFAREIAPARTFVFYEEVKPLMDKGLIRGGSLENAIVIRGDTTMSKEPLRFPDEFVRHKILDLIGDLALAGHPFQGHVLAVKPGHGSNNQLARELARLFQARTAMAKPVEIPPGGTVLNIDEVMSVLPHRYPFLMVDRVVDFPSDNECIGIKTVTINEPYFQGHFPGHPVMPGVLQVEAMAQVASILMLRKNENVGKIGYFMSADNVKFRKPVRPGDLLVIEARISRARTTIAAATCRCSVNGRTVSEGDLKFNLLPR